MPPVGVTAVHFHKDLLIGIRKLESPWPIMRRGLPGGMFVASHDKNRVHRTKRLGTPVMKDSAVLRPSCSFARNVLLHCDYTSMSLENVT